MDNRPPIFLDSSVLIAAAREKKARRLGAATTALIRLSGRRLIVSVVTVEEVLEGSDRPDLTLAQLSADYTVQAITLAVARRCALIQSRARQRLGENDAWIVAQAEIASAAVLGRDRVAFTRLGSRYLRF